MKNSRGGKLSRSAMVTVRFDPNLRYLTEIAARAQRRTVSSFIEWAVEQSLGTVFVDEKRTLRQVAKELWDVDEPDRFVKLALFFPHLLSHEEQILWKLIKENGFLWGGQDINGEWRWTVNVGSILMERLREHWEVFKKVAGGELDQSSLPRRNEMENVPF